MIRSKKQRENIRDWFKGLTKDISCVVCGENERCCIDFHHLAGDPFKHRTAKGNLHHGVTGILHHTMNKTKVLEEMEKCITICSNCHRKVHAGKLKI